ncbi:prenyltransferase/squalene oxidase repeat-containing protein [Streptomyces sp. NPDC059627]
MNSSPLPSSVRPVSIPSVAPARQRLTDHLLGQVAADGSVRGRCASRVLESALVLALLRDSGHCPEQREEIARYLRRHPGARGTLDRVLSNAALRLGPEAENGWALSWLDGFEHFTAPRKRLMFETVLAALGVLPYDHDVDPDAIEYRGFASWVDLSLCSVRALHLAARGRGAPVEQAFLEERLERGSTQHVWERNVLAHVLALTALHRLTPGHRLVREGLAAVLDCQNPDGGIPFITGLEIFCTATAGLALMRSHADATPRPTALGDYLAARQQADGGWAYAEGVRQTDVDDTAYCLQFLQALAPQRYAGQIEAGTRYLLRIANRDGGFPTFIHGHASETAMTAGALTALAPRWEDHPGLAQASLEYLLMSQRPDGTFERSWSLSEANAVFRTLEALHHAEPRQSAPLRTRISRATALALGHLMTAQNSDGGWGQRASDPSDPISTSYALLATRRWQRTPAHRQGIGYLLTQQRDDGGFSSRPDQAAPRPLPYDVPVLADICALWALSQHAVEGEQ